MVAATCISRRSSGSVSSHSASVLGKIARERHGVDLAQHRRRLAHRDRARPERLDHEAEALQFFGARHQPLGVGGIELDDLGNQQDLPRDARLLERGLHALVDQPLMRGVLIDDHQPVAGLRDDVGVVHLRAGGAERTVEQIGRGLGHLDAGGRGRRADVERGLRGFGEARLRRRSPCRHRAARRQRPRRRAPPVERAAARAVPPGGTRRWSRCRRWSRRAALSRASASLSECMSSERTSVESRKRTSVLAGCTFTSTSRGGSVTNSATTGWRSRDR